MHTDQKKTEPVKTVLVITLGMMIVYMATGWRPALNIAMIVGLGGFLSSYLAEKIDYVWMQLARILGLIIPNILLSAIFYLFLTPLAWLSRMAGNRNPLTLKNTGKTMFKEHNRVFDKTSFEKPW
jgi:hypothetical protein